MTDHISLGLRGPRRQRWFWGSAAIIPIGEMPRNMYTYRADGLSPAWCHGRAKVVARPSPEASVPVELQWCQVLGLCQGSILELSSTRSVPHSFSEHLLNCWDWPGKSSSHRASPSPSQEIQVKLKSLHWQVTAVWWLRPHLGSRFSRKPIFSWSSCPVFQLLLCRLKLMGEPWKRALCFVTCICHNPPPRPGCLLALLTTQK